MKIAAQLKYGVQKDCEKVFTNGWINKSNLSDA